MGHKTDKGLSQEAIRALSEVPDIANFQPYYPKSSELDVRNMKNVDIDKELKEEIENRDKEMRDTKNDVDTFIVDKFSKFGV